MGEQDRNGGFRSISESFKIVKSIGVMVSSSFGDRLTTGMSSAEPVQGRTSFGVSTKEELTIMTEHKRKNFKLETIGQRNIDESGEHEYHAASSQEVYLKNVRGIAQSGSAPALGAGCREFESLYPDQFQPAIL
tara:strand:+ start:28217 stop:28618 length:402 start_codon:yes stop_codon:yes gene_type:complete